MAISNIRDRRAETVAVRRALAAAGIRAVVAHGRGTAWGWLEVNIGTGEQFGPHESGRDCGSACSSDCARCVSAREAQRRAEQIVREVTGRSGGYHGSGDILILTQAAWCQRCRAGYPVHMGHACARAGRAAEMLRLDDGAEGERR